MKRMISIVQIVAVSTSDTMISVTFANLLNEVCNSVEVGPCFQSLQGLSFANRSTATAEDSGLDIKANSFLESRFSRPFFDVKVFNQYARSCPRSVPDSYKCHQAIKNLKYGQKIIEKATFCPLTSFTGGAGPSASKAIQRLASRGSGIRKKILIQTWSRT